MHSCAGVCGPALTSRSVCSPAPRYSAEECGVVFCEDELSDIRPPYCEGSDRMLSVLSVSLPLGPGASSGESVAVRRAGSRAAPPSCSHTYGAASTENHRRVHFRVKLPPSRTQGKETRELSPEFQPGKVGVPPDRKVSRKVRVCRRVLLPAADKQPPRRGHRERAKVQGPGPGPGQGPGPGPDPRPGPGPAFRQGVRDKSP